MNTVITLFGIFFCVCGGIFGLMMAADQIKMKAYNALDWALKLGFIAFFVALTIGCYIVGRLVAATL